MRLLLFILLLIPAPTLAFDFTLHRQLGPDSGPTVLVIGGIQGDEPGGFNAAALLTTHYRIENGALWVVPNLNFDSIIKRSRGLHGDMNRKFAELSKSDPEYHQIARIKQIITDPRVDLVFNLHDGSGFFRPDYVDGLHNPDRWGQSCIIDQQKLPGQRFGNLAQLASTTVARVNDRALQQGHRFRLKNTRTRWTETDMRQSLTYFAVRNNKPAFGIEASKNFPTHVRAYYHLLALEAYMDQVGLRFQRDFPLTPEGVDKALNENVRIAFGDGRIQLELNDLRPELSYFPLPKKGGLEFYSNNPLVAVVPHQKNYRIHYGNNRLSFLNPQYFDYDESLDRVEMLVDGVPQQVEFGSTIPVNEDFQVSELPGYRVNVIGFYQPGCNNESGVTVSKGQLHSRYSIDRGGKRFRVEVYHGKRFSGMILVDFRDRQEPAEPLVTLAARPDKKDRPTVHSSTRQAVQ